MTKVMELLIDDHVHPPVRRMSIIIVSHLA